MAELADAADLKSAGLWSSGFESLRPYQIAFICAAQRYTMSNQEECTTKGEQWLYLATPPTAHRLPEYRVAALASLDLEEHMKDNPLVLDRPGHIEWMVTEDEDGYLTAHGAIRVPVNIVFAPATEEGADRKIERVIVNGKLQVRSSCRRRGAARQELRPRRQEGAKRELHALSQEHQGLARRYGARRLLVAAGVCATSWSIISSRSS